MLEILIQKLMDDNLKKHRIEYEETEIFRYGYRILLEKIMIFSLMIVLCVFFQTWKEMIVYLMVLIPLRDYVGGYHAKQDWQCALLSVLLFLAMMLVSRNISGERYQNAFLVLEVFLWVTVFLIVPVEHPNKPLSLQEKRYCAMVSRVIFSVQALAAVGCITVIKERDVFLMIVISHVIVVGLLLAEMIRRRIWRN